MVADISKTDLLNAIQELTKTTVPLIYWTGYASLALVSALFIRHWSVKVSESPLVRIFPRRWLDTEGRKVREFWEAALKAVLGLVIFRPGISQVCDGRGKIFPVSNSQTQTEIKWRLRSTYDRQEVYEVVRHLLMEGFLRAEINAGYGISQDVTTPLDDDEGRHVFYFIGNRRWYHV